MVFTMFATGLLWANISTYLRCPNFDVNPFFRPVKYTLIEKDHLGDWSPEKDCCLRLTFRQPVRKPSSESSDSLSQLKIQKSW